MTRCRRRVHETTSDRCDRERGHDDVCCWNQLHPSGCGSMAGVPRDYLDDVLPGLATESLAALPKPLEAN